MPQILQKLVTQNDIAPHPTTLHVHQNISENFKSFKLRFTPLTYSVQKAFTGDNKISELKGNIYKVVQI